MVTRISLSMTDFIIQLTIISGSLFPIHRCHASLTTNGFSHEEPDLADHGPFTKRLVNSPIGAHNLSRVNIKRRTKVCKKINLVRQCRSSDSKSRKTRTL
ncbi:hypothetical protein PGT21_028075 [Puccinia graminis f. sp. tritici]|uniref:Uncharacterized protein n=1 Tax=Puccinia graminis f. sp. tritici TaxID=56615 RepID=A0A5B0S6E3_PUCGR|nr:hypothetical protein PGT21_028075 [Puccinia graminis f. sp. tritici]KAA1132985.1 hypothetical protein PGTUg99_018689 [Puccinia graminis f. sp. tritici]